MSLKAILAKPFARSISASVDRNSRTAVADQEKILMELVRRSEDTLFGIDHRFPAIHDHKEFLDSVPVRDYEGLKPYIEKIIQGEENILWPGLPIYFAKTSGTTSGTKYIPITKESMPSHIKAARNSLCTYISHTGNTGFVNGKMIFLQGSPALDTSGTVPTGRLSGIVHHHVPGYLLKNRKPTFETNCIEDWEDKLDAIIKETVGEKMSLISGIPPWVQMYFDRLLEHTGKQDIASIFPNFSLFVYGGVNFEPYRSKMMSTIGREVDTIETYPASEGFIAFQDKPGERGLLLNTWSGMYFEFIPVEKFHDPDPPRLSLADVELGVNYVLVLSTNAGLWSYNIGDTVKFTSIDPYRLVVTGRIKHFISAFGEHVIAEEVDKAMTEATSSLGIDVNEFTVAPYISDNEGESYHEWFVELNDPQAADRLAGLLDRSLIEQNSYYADLREGKMLIGARVTPVEIGAFNSYMDSIGKLGGQNKLPRLSNDRKIADALASYLLRSDS